MPTLTISRLNQAVYVAQILQDSLVDGPGLRHVLFFSGCQVKCPECHNQAYWDKNAGQQTTVAALAAQLRTIGEQSGNWQLTFSGGEPMEQLPAMLALIEALPEFDFGLYTSYRLAQVPSELLSRLSFIKVGRYVSRKKVAHQYFGSSNQQLIYLNQSFSSDHAA